MPKRHTWQSAHGLAHFRTACGRILAQKPELSSDRDSSFTNAPRTTNCLVCLRAIRDQALWKAQRYSEQALEWTEELDKQTRAANRRKANRG